MIERLNKACKFFPCHTGLEDCTFCYCPFYPCLDDSLGRFIHSPKLKKDIWSCEDCNWIHKKRVVDEIFSFIRENKRRPKIALKNKETGVVILGHGSKLKKANSILDEVIRVVKRRFGLSAIVPAHLQFSRPNLSESIKNLVNKGCSKIIIIPFFLFNGNHVTRDIPRALKKEMALYPEVSFVYSKNIGKDARLGEIVADRIMEVTIGACN